MKAADRRSRKRNLWAMYEGRCFWCEKKMLTEPGNAKFPKANYFTIDELVPVSRGGGRTLDNQVPAHRICNERRGNMMAPKAAIARHRAKIEEKQNANTIRP